MTVDDGPQGEQKLLGLLFTPDARVDPYPLYAQVDVPGCRHAVATRMLRDPRMGPPILGLETSDEVMWTTFARFLLNLDGDRHREMRRRFARIFTPGRVEQYRPAIEARAHALIDAVIERGSMDLVTEYARPLPFAIISTVLGVPEDRWPWVAERMLALDEGFVRQQEPGYIGRASTAVAEMLECFGDLLDERAEHPRDDLLSRLATDAPQDEEGRRDLLANCIFFIEAGHATTSSLIAGGLALLLQHPDQLDLLRRDPGLLPAAVEEVVRMIAPVSVVLVRAREDLEIDGHRFAAGERRVVFPAGANRDPDAFADPDRFDITRADNPHLSFSGGAHLCLGAPLARLHGEVGLRALLDRLPDLHLAGDPQWLGSIPLREPEHVPVAWSSRR